MRNFGYGMLVAFNVLFAALSLENGWVWTGVLQLGAAALCAWGATRPS